MNIRIDPEFEKLIPPLSSDEFQKLEQTILEDGAILNPLIVWDGIIIDGHHRFRIAEKHPHIQYTTFERSFPNRHSAIAWIYKNQLGQRNLSHAQYMYLIGKLYELEKLGHGGNRNPNHDYSGKFAHGSSESPTISHSTSERIAKEYRTSRSSVLRAHDFSKAVDTAETVSPGFRDKVLAGKLNPTITDVNSVIQARTRENKQLNSNQFRKSLIMQVKVPKENIPHAYHEAIISSSHLFVPSEFYQRDFSHARAAKIAARFDERFANAPKVSCRDGKYYVINGQHTIAARKILNHGQDLPIRCNVYHDMTIADEARLFIQENSDLTPGELLWAQMYAHDPDAVDFLKATQRARVLIDYPSECSNQTLSCITTARKIFSEIGPELYVDALRIISEAWDGFPDAFRKENLIGISYFVALYHNEYNRNRLISQLKAVDSLTIYRGVRTASTNHSGYKKYLFQVWKIYNGNSKRHSLPLKF